MTFTFLSEPSLSHFVVQQLTPDSFLLAFFFIWSSVKPLSLMRCPLTASCCLQVHNILAEMVMGGMVLETNMNEIITQVDAQNKMEKSEVRGTPACLLYVQF